MLIGGWIEVKLMLVPLIWGILLALTGALWLFTRFKASQQPQVQDTFGYSNMIELLIGLVLNGLITGMVIGGL